MTFCICAVVAAIDGFADQVVGMHWRVTCLVLRRLFRHGSLRIMGALKRRALRVDVMHSMTGQSILASLGHAPFVQQGVTAGSVYLPKAGLQHDNARRCCRRIATSQDCTAFVTMSRVLSLDYTHIVRQCTSADTSMNAGSMAFLASLQDNITTTIERTMRCD